MEVKNISNEPYFSSLGVIWPKHTTVGNTSFDSDEDAVKHALIADHPTKFVDYPVADQEADEAEADLKAACAELRRLTPLAAAARLEIARLTDVLDAWTQADEAYDSALSTFETKDALRTLPRDSELVDLCANQLPVLVDPEDATYPTLTFDDETKTYSIIGVEDTALVGKVLAVDPEGTVVTYEVTTNPAHGSVVVDDQTGIFTYTPDADYNGEDEFKITAEDVKEGKAVATVAVTLTAVADLAPVTATTSTETAVEIDVLDGNTFAGGTITITHADGQALVEGTPITLTNEAGTVELLSSNKLKFTPASAVTGEVGFTFTATTALGTPETTTVTVTVGT